MPRAWLTWDEAGAGLSKQAVLEALAQGSPAIRVMEEYAGQGLLIDPTTLLEGQEAVIVDRLRRIFAGRGGAPARYRGLAEPGGRESAPDV